MEYSILILALFSFLLLQNPVNCGILSRPEAQKHGDPSSSTKSIDITGIPRPLAIAHRGSSGIYPEHTMQAYRQAIQDGADYIECDVTLTRDLVPVCLHENYLSRTTDVKNRTEFLEKKRNITTPDGTRDDWYAIDFDLVELKNLKKKQAMSFRDKSFNGLYDIPTFEEFLQLANEHPNVGIYPELKDSEWLNGLDIMNGSKFEDIALELLVKYGYNSESSLCFIQSFSDVPLEYLKNKTSLKTIMLLETGPSNEDLDKWKEMGVDGLGMWTSAISPHHTDDDNGYKNWINGTTDLVERAHSRQLQVHVWTIRNEDMYLAWDFRQNVHREIDHFMKLGVDGFFSDFPETLVEYFNVLYANPPDEISAGVMHGSTAYLMSLISAVLCLYLH